MRSFFLRYIMLMTIFFSLANMVHAQIKKPGITLGGYAMFARPQAGFADQYSFGAGAEAFGGVGWGNTFILGTAGFSAFKAKSSTYGTLTYIPVKLGVKQFVLKKFLFINFDLGIASVKNKTVNAPRFTRGIGAGVRLPGVEAALYYDGWKNKDAKGFSNVINLKFGWSISL